MTTFSGSWSPVQCFRKIIGGTAPRRSSPFGRRGCSGLVLERPLRPDSSAEIARRAPHHGAPEASKVGLPRGAFDDLELTGVFAVALSWVKVGLPRGAFDDSELSGLLRMGPRSGSGRTGARNGHFLIEGQERRKWLWPAGGLKW